MKNIFALTVLFATVFSFSSSAQQPAQNNLSQLLNQYYNIRNALVAGDPSSAASNAKAFITAANTVDYKIISEGNINALLNDATPISEINDLSKQRRYFENLSANMIALAKAGQFGSETIYQAYCPMKKASWLTSDTEIRNPYYGTAMLSCGKITGTIQPRH